MHKLTFPAAALGVMTLVAFGASNANAQTDPAGDPVEAQAPADDVDVEELEVPDQNNGDLPEPPEAEEPDLGDIETSVTDVPAADSSESGDPDPLENPGEAPDVDDLPDAGAADPTDTEVEDPTEVEGTTPEGTPEGDVVGGGDPNESGVTETADLLEAGEAAEPTDTEVEEPTDVEVADPTDTEVDDPADAEAADQMDTDVADPPILDDPADPAEDDDDDDDDDDADDADDESAIAQQSSRGRAVPQNGQLATTGGSPSSIALIGGFAMAVGGAMYRVSTRRASLAGAKRDIG